MSEAGLAEHTPVAVTRRSKEMNAGALAKDWHGVVDQAAQLIDLLGQIAKKTQKGEDKGECDNIGGRDGAEASSAGQR